ncbi:MAG: hypothetical protein MI922_01700 [Bacteroidales bacterium]|nr:hypothetical protein [Bacteroidales bacterium]
MSTDQITDCVPKVPDYAYFNEEWDSWIVLIKGDPCHNAIFKWWDADVKSYGEFEGYKQGNKFVINGYDNAYYLNGELQWSKNYEHGSMVGEAIFYRSSHAAQYNVMFKNMGANVWSFKNIYKNGIAVARRYYSKDNVEVDIKGNPLPDRVNNVSVFAKYISKGQYWFVGTSIKKNGKTVRIGKWQWWNKDGSIKREDLYADSNEPLGKLTSFDGGISYGDLIEQSIFYSNGTVKKSTKFSKGLVSQTKEYYSNGNLKSLLEKATENNVTVYAKYFENGELSEAYRNESQTPFKLIKHSVYYSNGALKAQKEMVEDKAHCSFYYNHGILRAKGTCDTSGYLPNSEWKFFNNSGKIVYQPTFDKVGNLYPEYFSNREEWYEILFKALMMSEINVLPIPDYLGLGKLEQKEWKSFSADTEDEYYIRFILKGLISEKPQITNFVLDAWEEYEYKCTDKLLFSKSIDYAVPYLFKILEHNTAAQSMVIKILPRLIRFVLDNTNEYTISCRKKIMDRIWVFKRLLDNGNMEVRSFSVFIIAMLLYNKPDVKLEFLTPVWDEDSIAQQGNVLLALGYSDYQDKNTQCVLKPFIRNRNVFLRYCAAISLFRISNALVDKQVLDIIFEAVEQPQVIQKKFENYLCFSLYSKYGLTGAGDDCHLSQLYGALCCTVYDSLVLHIMRSVKFGNYTKDEKIQLIDQVLYLTFEKENYNGDNLSEEQEAVLEYIWVNYPKIASFEEVYELLSKYNVDIDFKELF